MINSWLSLNGMPNLNFIWRKTPIAGSIAKQFAWFFEYSQINSHYVKILENMSLLLTVFSSYQQFLLSSVNVFSFFFIYVLCTIWRFLAVLVQEWGVYVLISLIHERTRSVCRAMPDQSALSSSSLQRCNVEKKIWYPDTPSWRSLCLSQF